MKNANVKVKSLYTHVIPPWQISLKPGDAPAALVQASLLTTRWHCRVSGSDTPAPLRFGRSKITSKENRGIVQ